MQDRIKHLCEKYIRADEITLEERDDLMDMHKAYKDLGGNGKLNALIGDVMRLRLVITAVRKQA